VNLVAFTIPIRTVSALNAREHFRVRAKRVKAEREATAWVLPNVRLQLPVKVHMTRVGPTAGLDSDNLPGSMKGCRDEIAKWLGIDDRDARVEWSYSQRRDTQWGVEVRISQG
jgi:hypothetical protein